MHRPPGGPQTLRGHWRGAGRASEAVLARGHTPKSPSPGVCACDDNPLGFFFSLTPGPFPTYVCVHVWGPPGRTWIQRLSKRLCQTFVSNVCVKHLCQAFVSNVCVKRLCQAFVSNVCVKRLCQTFVSSLLLFPTRAHEFVSVSTRTRTHACVHASTHTHTHTNTGAEFQ